MTRLFRALAGLSLLFAGGLKIHDTATAQGGLIVPGCMSGEFILPISAPAPSLLHCWGCYLAGVGIALMAWAILLRSTPTIRGNWLLSR
ncbi:MAG: hypothetical protein AAF216_03835 [Pseudomonadota bacterium]